MKYTAYFYQHAVVKFTKKLEANSFEDALRKAYTYAEISHITIVAEDGTCARFMENPQAPQYFKTSFHSDPSILVVIGEAAEHHRFNNTKERDEALCHILSGSAESAEAGPQQSDTIVYIEGTSDSKSSLTSRKIWNGYVISATWKVAGTHKNTSSTSGKDSASGSEPNTWSAGIKPSHCESGTTMAMVRDLSNVNEGAFGITNHMLRMKDQIVLASLAKSGGYYLAEGYSWEKTWLKRVYIARVNDLPDDEEVSPGMRKMVGYVFFFDCNEGVFTELDSGQSFKMDWLTFADLRRVSLATENGKKMWTAKFESTKYFVGEMGIKNGDKVLVLPPLHQKYYGRMNDVIGQICTVKNQNGIWLEETGNYCFLRQQLEKVIE